MHSRALTYELDTAARTATLISNYNYMDSSLFSPFMGGFYFTDNGERVAGWSANQARYVLTEFDDQGNVLLEMRSIDTFGLVSYRVQKQMWETNAVSFDLYTYFIENASVGQTSLMEFEFTNNGISDFLLNGFHSSDSTFTLLETLPITLTPSETIVLTLLFTPAEAKSYTSAISLFTDNQQKRIAKQFRVNTAVVSSIKDVAEQGQGISLSSNPATNYLTITNLDGNSMKQINVFDALGKKTLSVSSNESDRYFLNVDRMKPGVYVVVVETETGYKSKKFVLQ